MNDERIEEEQSSFLLQLIRTEGAKHARQTVADPEFQRPLNRISLSSEELVSRALENDSLETESQAELTPLRAVLADINSAGGRIVASLRTPKRSLSALETSLIAFIGLLAAGTLVLGFVLSVGFWSGSVDAMAGVPTWLRVTGTILLSAGIVVALLYGTERISGGSFMFAEERIMLFLGVALALGAVLSTNRLWNLSWQNLGTVWTIIIWVVAGLVIAIAVLFLSFEYLVSMRSDVRRLITASSLAVGTLSTILIRRLDLEAPQVSLSDFSAALPWTVVVAGVSALIVALRERSDRKNGAGTVQRPYSIDWSAVRDLSDSYSRRTDLKGRFDTAFDDWSRAARYGAIPSLLRQQVNEIVTPPFSLEMKVLSAPGLHHMRAGDLLVRTASVDRVRESVARVAGGALGIAGPRGVGKSTILDAAAEGRLTARARGAKPIVVRESVPVKYDPRDFVLHLYARFCEEVAGKAPERRRTARVPRALLANGLPLVALAGWSLAGFALATGAIDPSDALRWGYWPSVIALVGLVYLHRPSRFNFTNSSRLLANNPDPLIESALRRLGEIRFQQRFSSGWAGKISTPLGGEMGSSQAIELSRTIRSYPEIVHEFRGFIKEVIETRFANAQDSKFRVLFVVDELDKISDWSAAQSFVNEIKSIFMLEATGCLYLVAVSDEALRSFELEGVSPRDSFNSAFDDIVRVDYLDYVDSVQILRSRIIGMSPAFEALCHCLSGGLPRELVRVARMVTDSEGDKGVPTMTMVSSRMIREAILERANGLRSVMVSSGSGAVNSEVLKSMQAVASGSITSEGLADIAGQKVSVASPESETSLVIRAERSSACFLYFASTVLWAFADGLTEERFTRLVEPGWPGGLDLLTSARAQIPVSPVWAWQTISSFREAWSCPTVKQPW